MLWSLAWHRQGGLPFARRNSKAETLPQAHEHGRRSGPLRAQTGLTCGLWTFKLSGAAT